MAEPGNGTTITADPKGLHYTVSWKTAVITAALFIAGSSGTNILSRSFVTQPVAVQSAPDVVDSIRTLNTKITTFGSDLTQVRIDMAGVKADIANIKDTLKLSRKETP